MTINIRSCLVQSFSSQLIDLSHSPYFIDGRHIIKKQLVYYVYLNFYLFLYLHNKFK
jgi:hypothetical protein